MNVEIGTEAAQFPEKKYINGIAVAVLFLCTPTFFPFLLHFFPVLFILFRTLCLELGYFFHSVFFISVSNNL
jgi:hypothetical protein